MKHIDEILSEVYKKTDWVVKTIGEIATEIYSGNGVTKNQLGTGDYPAIKCGDINSQLPIQFTECISFVDHDLIKKPKYFEYGDVLILDKFHTLTEDIMSRIPGLIKDNRERYEYYRDRIFAI